MKISHEVFSSQDFLCLRQTINLKLSALYVTTKLLVNDNLEMKLDYLYPSTFLVNLIWKEKVEGGTSVLNSRLYFAQKINLLQL